MTKSLFFGHVCQLLLCHAAATASALYHTNMNQGDNDSESIYSITNSDDYVTQFAAADVEYFEVTSNLISTLYGEVHWRFHQDKPLPAAIVERFRGRVMAVVGYEVDQVFDGDGDHTNSNNADRRVPITWAYNHHYGAFLHNSQAVRLSFQDDVKAHHDNLQRTGYHHGHKHVLAEFFDDQTTVVYPQLQFFSEANGGEMRGSWHGYPAGYAQLIRAPDVFSAVPMQIDTWDRKRQSNASYVPGAPLPRQSQKLGRPPYNALLECPCSDRIDKEWYMTYGTVDDDDMKSNNNVCTGPISNATECRQAARQVVPAAPELEYQIIVEDHPQYPKGCSLTVQDEERVLAVWNEADADVTEWKNRRITSPDFVAFGYGFVNATVALYQHENHGYVEMTLTGPADAWFGVGFGTSSMCWHMQADECPGGGPYAIIVIADENDNVVVQERKLDYHGSGVVLPSTLTVVSVQEHDDSTRTVVLQRSLQGASDRYFTFTDNPIVPMITATGCNMEFAQHCCHGPSELSFMPVGQPSQLCQTGLQGTIAGDKFDMKNRCLPYPMSDLIRQQNPTCSIETYAGGLSCCRDGHSLLDKDQDQPWPDQALEYSLKFRFYFQEYQPAVASEEGGQRVIRQAASHASLVRLYHQTESNAGEYDVPQCPPGTPIDQCIHVITAQWKVRDMMIDCEMRDASWCTGKNSSNAMGIKLIYAAPHCHAGTCLSMELYNADTGRLLCSVRPQLGRDSSKRYQEEHYLAIPPCLWSEHQDGLPQPELLSMDTTLLSIKRNNSTIPHTGEMASWQMRGIVINNNGTVVREPSESDE